MYNYGFAPMLAGCHFTVPANENWQGSRGVTTVCLVYRGCCALPIFQCQLHPHTPWFVEMLFDQRKLFELHMISWVRCLEVHQTKEPVTDTLLFPKAALLLIQDNNAWPGEITGHIVKELFFFFSKPQQAGWETTALSLIPATVTRVAIPAPVCTSSTKISGINQSCYFVDTHAG